MSFRPDDMNQNRRPRFKRPNRTDSAPYVPYVPQAPYSPPNHPNQFVIGLPRGCTVFMRSWRLVLAVFLLTSACWLCFIGIVLTNPTPAG